VRPLAELPRRLQVGISGYSLATVDQEKPTAKAVVQAAITELRALVGTYDPIELLARVTTYIVAGNPDRPKDEDGPRPK
jgi:hypothetical protein